MDKAKVKSAAINIAVLLFMAAVGAGASEVYHKTKYNNLMAFLASHGCTSLGYSRNPEFNKYLGEGFACGDSVVITPAR